jgi:hypothetical protein
MLTERRDWSGSTTGLGGRRKFDGALAEVQERVKIRLGCLGAPFLALFARSGTLSLQAAGSVRAWNAIADSLRCGWCGVIAKQRAWHGKQNRPANCLPPSQETHGRITSNSAHIQRKAPLLAKNARNGAPGPVGGTPLYFGEETVGPSGALDVLRMKLAQEPSIRGNK